MGTTRGFCALGIVLATILGPVAPTLATDAEPRPGVFGGSISVGGLAPSYSVVMATGSAGSVTTTTHTDRYALAVHVPAGSRTSYTLTAASYYPGGQISFPPQTVPVTAARTTTADFRMDSGTVQGTVTTTTVGTFAHVMVYWYSPRGGSSGYRGVAVSGAIVSFGVPVAAGDVTMWGWAVFTDGRSAFLGYRSAEVPVGGSTAVAWEIEEPAGRREGVIAGLLMWGPRHGPHSPDARSAPGNPWRSSMPQR